MLDPHQRRLLTEALQVPDGFELTDAIACTYSLDLLALASIPLLCLGHESTVLEDGEAEVGRQLAGIECVRRNMGRFTVFCQAGAIHEPAEAKSVFLWMEPGLVEVRVPGAGRQGVFHPKLWFLRFRAADGAIRYRVAVLSRNLTFDRSWDVVALLEGDLLDRKNRVKDSVPLADFVAALGNEIPAVHAMSDTNRTRVNRFAEELSRVKFSCPDADLSWRFWPIGIQGRRFDSRKLFSAPASPFKAWAEKARQLSKRELLVVSPFLGDGTLDSLVRLGATCPVHLVSDERTLDQFSQCAGAQPQGLGSDRVWAFGSHDPSDPLAGLHAKLWVADDGHEAHVWLGSANATNAAFERNIEVLLQLTGPKSALGIQTLLGTKGGAGDRVFRDLLFPYRAPGEVQEESAEMMRQRELDYHLMEIVCSSALEARASKVGDTFQLRLEGAAQYNVEVRPITAAPEARRPLGPGTTGKVVFDALAMHQLTELWALTMRDEELVATCVTRIPTSGMPDLQDRGMAVLSRHLGDMDALAQYLGFLMADGSIGLQAQLRAARRGRGTSSASDRPRPLLETLLRALVHQPQVLEDVEALLTAMGREAGEWLEEPEFKDLWTAMRAAKRELEGAAP